MVLINQPLHANNRQLNRADNIGDHIDALECVHGQPPELEQV